MSDDLELNKKELETIDIETPIEETGPEPTQPEPPIISNPKKSKKKKVLIILSIILVVLLLIAGGFYYWFFIKETPPIENTAVSGFASEETETVVDTTDYAKDLIEKIRAAEAALVAAYPQIKVEDSEAQSPANHPENEQYYIAGKIGHALLVSDSSATTNTEPFNTATEAAAVTVLDGDKTLTKTSSEMSVRYESSNVICSISHASYPFFATCANIRDYAPLEVSTKPFADAFKKGENTQNLASSIFGTPVITKGQDGYMNASVPIGAYEGVGGYAGLFYGKDSWTFWRGTQSYIPCEEYNTVELQKSFVGTVCYDEGDENAKVKVTL